LITKFFNRGILNGQITKFKMDTLCTVRLSRVLYPQYKKHNFKARFIERFDFECKNRHRGLMTLKFCGIFCSTQRKKTSEANFLEKL